METSTALLSLMHQQTYRLATFTLLIIIFSLTGCSHKTGNLWDISTPYSLSLEPPEGPSEYQQGWSDGCESGLSSTTTDLMLLIGVHQFTYDSELRHNERYKRIWKDAYNFCALYMMIGAFQNA